jgi:putative nucleotidyltransferase with HDIG domain
MNVSSDSISPLTLLLELGRVFHSTLELDPLLVSILKTVQSAVRSEGASIWLFNDAKSQITCTYAIGPHADEVLGDVVPAEDFHAIYQSTDGKAINLSADTLEWERARAFTQWSRPGTRSLLVAALTARNELLGVISVVNKIDADSFTDDERDLLDALAGHAAIAIHNAQLYERQKRNHDRQQLLDQINHYFQGTIALESLIPRIFQAVNEAIQAEGQSIWLLDDGGLTTTCRFAQGAGAESVINLTVPVDRSIVGNTITSQEPLLIPDAQQDPRFNRRADSKTGLVTRTLMSVPMVREGKSIGAIQAINKRGGRLFNEDDRSLFTAIASSAALAIENARLYAELAASYDLTLDALTAALDLRDRETEGHSRRVVEFTVRLAKQIGLTEEELVDIRRGALLHDVGKIGVPDRVLLKPGPLDTDERKEIEKHPQKGYEMLVGIRPLEQAIKIVLAHHEKWDGSGYPLNIGAERIPLGARLFSVADVFDALTSDRPYRSAKPYEVARQIIIEGAGKHFDPQVVEAFLAVPPDEWDGIRADVMKEVARRRELQARRVKRGHTGMLNPDALKHLPPAHGR